MADHLSTPESSDLTAGADVDGGSSAAPAAKKATKKATKPATKPAVKKAPAKKATKKASAGTAAKPSTAAAASSDVDVAGGVVPDTDGGMPKAPAKRAPAKKAAKRATKKATIGTASAAAADGDAADDPSTDVAAERAPASGPLVGTDGEDGAASSRTRTRTRSRSRGDASAAEDAVDAPASEAPVGAARRRARMTSSAEDTTSQDAQRSDGMPSDDADGPSDGDGTGSPRRRRRGGRGRRGRGRGGAASEALEDGREDVQGADDGDDHEPAPVGADRPAGRSRSRSRARGGKGAAGAGSSDAEEQDERGAKGTAKDKDKDKDTTKGKAKGKGRSKAKGAAQDDAEDDTEERIARGGTRLAAKKSRRGGGSGGGGTGGGGTGGGRRNPRVGGVTEEERRAILAGPPRTMIVTARPERTQIAVMEDRTLVEHYVTRDEDVTFVGNIYMGRVQNVLPGMEAAFIDIGKGRNGVLYAGEVLYDEHDLEEEAGQRIENVLKPGQKVLVQVTKDPMGTKGPRLTMHLSLAGRYVVLAPDSDLFGISRKLTDEERDRLRRIVKAAKPEGHGVIVRTAAEGATEEALTADVERLVARWRKVEEASRSAKPLATVYEEPKLVVKVIRDIFGPDFVRCILDEETLFDQVRDYLAEVAPELVERVELYGAPTDDERSQAAGAPSLAAAVEAAAAAQAEREASGVDATGIVAAVEEVTPEQRRKDLPPLFTAFDVTDQLRQAMNRKVWLPSGGYLIIEATEAMKVIDVNTGRFTGGSDSNLEEIVLKTNLEAADEIVRQLRLRDMGGMIIIDFIDMLLRSNQEQVVRRLKRELLRDRTKTRVSDVSRLGLVQMTRKNVSQGLVESFSSRCEKCDGHGFLSTLG
jgi:ribonuclease E